VAGRWLAPESMEDFHFSAKSDIWSLGITLYEVLTHGGVPFGSIPMHKVQAVVLQGIFLLLTVARLQYV
jgi:serine/threonine protein kinase